MDQAALGCHSEANTQNRPLCYPRNGDEGRLVKTVSFSTPSGAADFVLGGSNNGWIEWKDSEKQTLDALYRK